MGHRVCGDITPGGFTFRVIHNNLLTPDLPGGGIYNQKWLYKLKAMNASILILNKGSERRPSEWISVLSGLPSDLGCPSNLAGH